MCFLDLKEQYYFVLIVLQQLPKQSQILGHFLSLVRLNSSSVLISYYQSINTKPEGQI